MSDVQRLEQKIDDHISSQEKSTIRIETSLEKIAAAMATFIGFQARAEERHSHYEEFKADIKQDVSDIKSTFVKFYDDEYKPLAKLVNRNAIITNAVVGVC